MKATNGSASCYRMNPRPIPPDIASAVEALRDKLLLTEIGVDEAIRVVCDDWEVKHHVLNIRFQARYGMTPQSFSENARNSLRKSNPHIKTIAKKQIKPQPSNDPVPGINAKVQPDPRDFGLQEGFSIDDYDKSLFLLEFNIFKWALIAAPLVSIFVFMVNRSGLQDLGPYMVGAFALSILIFLLARFIITNANGPASKILKTQRLASKYRVAVLDWRATQTESGLSYWQSLKGVEFESAVKRLLERRGCKASLTPATGDGGVDIVVSGIDATYWCQCKGHSKKISVGEVRQIKGACSNRAVSPVLISSNGFTNPAVEEASRLGVILIDSEALCRLANQNQIFSLKRDHPRTHAVTALRR